MSMVPLSNSTSLHCFVVFVSDLVQGCGVEQAGVGGQGIVAAGIEVAVVPPGTWAASVVDLSGTCPL